MEVPGVMDGPVTAGIRPEGFVPNPNGRLQCRLSRVEVMGRDISVVCENDSCDAPIRAIISAEAAVNAGAETVCFDVKENKLFLFDSETGERLRFGKE